MTDVRSASQPRVAGADPVTAGSGPLTAASEPLSAAEAAAEAVAAEAAASDGAAEDSGLDEAVATRPGGVKGLIARFEHVLREVGKFGAVGGVSYVVDVSIFNLLRFSHVESLTSATISMTVAASVAFVGNRFWTWRDRERTGLRREYLLYFLFNLVGLGIGLSCLALSTYGLGSVWPGFKSTLAENISKNIIGMALGTVFRFWSYRQIVFRR